MAKYADGLITALVGDQIPSRLRVIASKYRKLADELGYTGLVVWHNQANEQYVFCVPRLIPESKGHPIEWQLQTLDRWRMSVNLPSHHLSSFGRAEVLSGVICSHWQATKEAAPLHGQWVVTDTPYPSYRRIILGFGRKGLRQDSCHIGGASFIGSFPLGIEPRP